jgi:long-chain acyl-CoA synthetase
MNKPWLKHYDKEVPDHIDYPRIPVYQLLDNTAPKYPDRPSVRFFGKQYTFAQMLDFSNRFAAGLRNLGIQKGDKVGILLPNCPQYIIAYYGILKAGGVVVPLNPLYTARELSFHIENSGAETVVTIPMFMDKVAELRGSTPLKRIICGRLADFLPFPLNVIQGLREGRLVNGSHDPGLVRFKDLLATPVPSDFRSTPVDPDEMAVLIYSGGTTGVAKGIMLSHFSIVANAYQMITWASLNTEARTLAVLPLFHGFGMSVNMNAPILAGAETILVPRFKAKEVVKMIHQQRPTFFIGVPTMFTAFSNLPDIDRYDFSSIKGFFVGAAPLTQATKANFEAKSGGRMIEGYGLTEAVTGVMGNPYRGMHKLGSIGIPFPDMEVRIGSLDDEDRDLPPCEQGEIILRGPTLMLGYYNLPEQTAETLRNGWLYTGDIG